MTGHPKDVCECGDYRDQHKDGTGACAFNPDRAPLYPSDAGHSGAGRCDLFRISYGGRSSGKTYDRRRLGHGRQ